MQKVIGWAAFFPSRQSEYSISSFVITTEKSRVDQFFNSLIFCIASGTTYMVFSFSTGLPLLLFQYLFPNLLKKEGTFPGAPASAAPGHAADSACEASLWVQSKPWTESPVYPAHMAKWIWHPCIRRSPAICMCLRLLSWAVIKDLFCFIYFIFRAQWEIFYPLVLAPN